MVRADGGEPTDKVRCELKSDPGTMDRYRQGRMWIVSLQDRRLKTGKLVVPICFISLTVISENGALPGSIVAVLHLEWRQLASFQTDMSTIEVRYFSNENRKRPLISHQMMFHDEEDSLVRTQLDKVRPQKRTCGKNKRLPRECGEQFRKCAVARPSDGRQCFPPEFDRHVLVHMADDAISTRGERSTQRLVALYNVSDRCLERLGIKLSAQPYCERHVVRSTVRRLLSDKPDAFLRERQLVRRLCCDMFWPS